MNDGLLHGIPRENRGSKMITEATIARRIRAGIPAEIAGRRMVEIAAILGVPSRKLVSRIAAVPRD